MKSSQTLVIGVAVLVIIACSGCVGGGNNAQIFETKWGKAQLITPQKLPLTSVVTGNNIVLSIEGTFVPEIYIDFFTDNSGKITSEKLSQQQIRNKAINSAISDDNHKIYWYLDQSQYTKENSDIDLPLGARLWRGTIDYIAEENLTVNFRAVSVYADPSSGKYITAFEEEDFLNMIKSFKFLELTSKSQSTQPTETPQVPALKQQTEVSAIDNEDSKSGNDFAAEAIDTAPISGRTLDWITIKRNEIDPSGKDKYGHYWIEILDGPDGKPVESYGWWPKYPLSPDLTGAVKTLGGVQGELNGITSFKGTSTKDPDQGTTAKREFHPKLMNTLTDQQVLDKIHDFVRSYKGEWRWTFGWGQNCQTFQTALMKNVGLDDPDSEDISKTDSSTSTTQKSANTKTAYTHDGISYISKERVDENIKAGVAKPGDYEEVQVPLDTFVVGGSTISN
jgi:hypothetical protein